MKLALTSTLLLLAGCASGHGMVTGTPRQSVQPDAVVVYAAPPPQYEIIGVVTATRSTFAKNVGLNVRDKLIEELRKQAAKLGANGLLLGDAPAPGSFGGMYTGPAPAAPAPVESEDVQELKGRAIYVTTE